MAWSPLRTRLASSARDAAPGFQIVTPGIRSGPAIAGDDQARTLSAAEAMAAGANYLVIGRPILTSVGPGQGGGGDREDFDKGR